MSNTQCNKITGHTKCEGTTFSSMQNNNNLFVWIVSKFIYNASMVARKCVGVFLGGREIVLSQPFHEFIYRRRISFLGGNVTMINGKLIFTFSYAERQVNPRTFARATNCSC